MATTYDRAYVDAAGYEHRYPQHAHDEGEEVECLYCGATIPGCTDCPNAPPEDDDTAWAELAAQHREDCEWVLTRAHRRDLLASWAPEARAKLLGIVTSPLPVDAACDETEADPEVN